MNVKTECYALAEKLKLTVCYHNPGEGPKVRVYLKPGCDWFDWHYIFATNGKGGDWSKTLLFLQGFEQGMKRLRNEIDGDDNAQQI